MVRSFLLLRTKYSGWWAARVVQYLFWPFLNYENAPGPFVDRGYAVYQMLSLYFPVQPQSAELPATTEGRWRRRHLLPGHKTELLTVLLTCTGCVFQVATGVGKSATFERARRQ